MEKEKRILNISFGRGGSGSVSASIRLPISWIRKMGVEEEKRQVEAEFNGEKIILKKTQKPIDYDVTS